MNVHEFSQVYYNLPEEKRNINDYFYILHPFVVHLAKSYRNVVPDYDERVQIAWIGATKALNSYDLSKDVKLTTYMGICVNNEFCMLHRKSNKDLCDAKDENGDRVARVQLDGPPSTTEDHTVSELIGSEDPNYEDILVRDMLRELDSVCTPHQSEVLRRLAEGQNLKQIGIEMNKNSGNLSKTRQVIRKKFNELYL